VLDYSDHTLPLEASEVTTTFGIEHREKAAIRNSHHLVQTPLGSVETATKVIETPERSRCSHG